MKCTTDSKALSNFVATPIPRLCLSCTKTVPNTFTGLPLHQIPEAFRWRGGPPRRPLARDGETSLCRQGVGVTSHRCLLVGDGGQGRANASNISVPRYSSIVVH